MIKAVLCDIGDVLFTLRRHRRDAVVREYHGRADAKSYDGLDPAFMRDFATGKISEEEYVTHICRELAVPAYIVQEAEYQMIGDMAAGLVRHLAENIPVPLYALSNNTAIHWRIVEARLPPDMSAGAFLSQEIGLLKPDAAIYNHVLADLGASAADIVYIDDEKDNIEAALSCGMEHSIHHTDERSTIARLTEFLR